LFLKLLTIQSASDYLHGSLHSFDNLTRKC